MVGTEVPGLLCMKKLENKSRPWAVGVGWAQRQIEVETWIAIGVGVGVERVGMRRKKQTLHSWDS